MSLRHLARATGVAVVSLVAACGGASPVDGGASEVDLSRHVVARDWAQQPPVAELDGVAELWVVSDVHGDYQAFAKLLATARVIAALPSSPKAVQWTAGRATLVVVGDLIDKGPDSLDVVRLLASLSSAASSAGGHVVVTMGNHEAEFLADPTNSKASASDGVDHELSSTGLSPQQAAAGQGEIGAFLRGLPMAARVDDWFFVHAGKTDGKTIATLSQDLRGGIDQAGFGAAVLSAPDSLVEARLATNGAQWWDASGDAEGLLVAWTNALGTRHLVMGHQPGAVSFADGTTRARDRLFEKYGGLLFLIDTGLSVGVDHTGGSLLHVQRVGTAGATWQEVTSTGAVSLL